MFKKFHYLSDTISTASHCWIGVWNGVIVCFGSSLAMPSGSVKNAWRGHRTVVLPDFQGLGIGVRFSDAIAQLHLDEGKRYFSRTAHPRMIWYRENSKLWKPTTKHKKLRKDITHNNIYKNHYTDNKRVCGSFEYIG